MEEVNNSFELGMEEQNVGGMEEMEAIETAAPAVEKGKTDLFVGLGIGLGTGLAAGTAAWFYERKKRLDVLETLEISIDAANEKNKDENATEIKYGKKVIDIKEMDIREIARLNKFIRDRMEKIKMRKKEKARWNNVIEALMTQAHLIGQQLGKQQTEEVFKGNGKFEATKENKIVKEA